MSIPLKREQFVEAVVEITGENQEAMTVESILNACWEVYRAALVEALTVVETEIAAIEKLVPE